MRLEDHIALYQRTPLPRNTWRTLGWLLLACAGVTGCIAWGLNG